MQKRKDILGGSASPGQARFATTHWSVVRSAARPDSEHYRQALETLCKTYWFPLYAYLRRNGHNADRAEEYTQAFFARLLEKRGVRLADPKRGRFRSFLLASLKNFLSDQRDYEQAKKRGGGRKILSLDLDSAENRYVLEPADRLSPERLFERSWALTVLDSTMARLLAEATTEKKKRLFDHLKVHLTDSEDAVPYAELAKQLDMTEGAIRVAMHRLRGRYRELLRDEIAQTVSTEAEIDQEIRDLFAALAR